MGIPILALLGCDQNLYVAHDTVLGINARLNKDRAAGKLVIGYDREFITIVPKGSRTEPVTGEEDQTSTSNASRDVMSSLGCNYLEAEGPTLKRYSDMVITGEAAIKLAAKIKEENDKFLDCNHFDLTTSKSTSTDGE
ncbi:hypothetical protein [Pseudophaeobacter leonis]|uniref:hypothetical protein n=1 Tax=Pseudophaeobacter leonis TaxID=1144477 RepID=UPI00111C7D1A|nr:hypothetical protein [Pseudophaeobacter leonis]